jgi:NAD(P)-dependent dehydrogenase (short-subunit alcohol dehydrogenase family)
MTNNNTFEGKVVLVTGGTSGIGKATAIAFARAGAKVVLTGRREKEGAQVVTEIKKLGGDAAFVRADIAKDADVKEMVKFTVDKFGKIDIAFNNAGVEWKGPLDQATEAEYRRIFDTNDGVLLLPTRSTNRFGVASNAANLFACRSIPNRDSGICYLGGALLTHDEAQDSEEKDPEA